MKTTLLLILVISVIATQAAYLRIIHASPDTGNVDVKVNNNLVREMTNVPYGNISQYAYNGYFGNFHVQVFPTGKSDPVLIDTTVTWNTLTEPWSLFVIDFSKNLNSILQQDGFGLIKDGRSALRFVQLSPDAPALDLLVNGNQTVFENVQYKDLTKYTELDPNSYAFQVVQTGMTTPLATLDAQLTYWTEYSIVVVGTVGGSAPLQLVIGIDI